MWEKEIRNGELLLKIDSLIVDERLFLDPDFNLISLVRKVGSNRMYVSMAVCSKHVNFRDYINKKRVEYLFELISEDTEFCLHDDSEEVAYKVGFPSRRTMDRALIKECGKSFDKLKRSIFAHKLSLYGRRKDYFLDEWSG